MQNLKTTIEENLDKNIISSRVLLDRMEVPDDNLRISVAYNDSSFINFYYYLGKLLTPKNFLELGFGLGFLSSCFLKSCPTVKNFFGFQERNQDFYSLRWGRNNLKNNYKNNYMLHYGKLTDEVFEKNFKTYLWDLIILNENYNYDQYMSCLDMLWERLTGYIVMDYLEKNKYAKTCFEDFCKIKNREFIIIDTRYKVGLIRK